MEEVGEEHAADEAHCAEHADGREVLHGVHAFLAKGVIGHGVHKCDGGHEERHAEAVEYEQRGKLDGVTSAHAVCTGPYHEDSGKSVAH